MSILPSSKISIEGSTNFSGFSCDYKDSVAVLNMALIPTSDLYSYEATGVINLRVKSFDCGLALMNNELQELLQEVNYPFIEVEILGVDFNIISQQWLIHSQFTIAGVTKKVDLPFAETKVIHGYDVIGIGEVKINLINFDIEPPVKFGGMVKVSDEINVLYRFHMRMEY